MKSIARLTEIIAVATVIALTLTVCITSTTDTTDLIPNYTVTFETNGVIRRREARP